MTQRIDVPGVGIVEFPDSMDDSQITAAIKDKIIPQYSPPKSAMEKFAEPFKDVSIKDWSEKSLLAPMLQTMRAVTPFGMLRPDLAAQDLKSGSENLVGKGKQMAQGAYQIATNPVESAQKAYTAVTENPAGVAGEMVKGMLYDPEMLIGSGLGNVAESAVKSTVQGAKTLGNVAEGAVNTLGRRGTQPGERATYAGQYESARQPAGNVYHTPENIQAWRAGQIDTAELNSRALPYTAEQAAALKRTGGMVPYTGQVARATGEALAEPYTRLSGYLPDIALGIGGTMLGVGPFAGPALNLARKGVGLYNAGKTAGGMRQLGDLGFEPLYAQETKALQYGRPHPSVIPTAAGPVSPQQLAAGPVSPQQLAAGKINPQTATTPAAQAAQATTQRVARQPAQPRVEWTLPDVGTHYNMAAQGSTNFGDTFNKAVAARTTDLLKDAKQRGQTLTREAADLQADTDIRKWRHENVEAFKPKQEPAGPVAPTITAEEAIAQFNPPKVDPELVSDKNIWARLQAKTQAGTPLEVNEQTAVRRITNKYGQDPFQTGDLKGNSVLEAVDAADGFQVRAGMKQSAKAGITTKNGKIEIDEAVFNDTAKSMGMPEIDFKSMPDLKGMGLAEARKAVETEINRQYKTAGVYGKTARGPNQSTLVKEANAKRTANMTPEQIAAEEQANLARLDKLGQFIKNNKAGTSTGISPGTVKPTTPEVAGPVRPEGAVDTPKMSNADLLALIKARSNKGNAPPGTMSMMTGKPNDFMGDVMMGKLKGNFDDVPTGSYTENGIRHEIIDNDSYTSMPDDIKKLVKDMPKKLYRQIDVKTGKVLQGAKSLADLQAEAADLLKKAQEGKKKQGK